MGWDSSAQAVAAAMSPMLLLLAPHLEGPQSHALLASGVSDMLQGNSSSIAFMQTVPPPCPLWSRQLRAHEVCAGPA